MKTLVDHLAGYAAYHRDTRNIAPHFIGIPMIVLAVATLLGRPAFGVPGLTPAVVACALATLFYLRLSIVFGVAMAVILAGFVHAGAWLAALPTESWLASGIGLFVAGWVIQFIGHYYEGRKPAFVDDLVGLLVGPLFLVAEVAFALGLARRTHAELLAHSH